MLSNTLLTLSLLPFSATAETVLGVYMFHRHGDRTAKSTPPTALTDLGFQEVFTSGSYYRSRYIEAGATNQIYGIAENIVKNSQISASAPSDTVLQNSATGFLAGLYPPVGTVLGSQLLGNGTNVTAPLDGYQLIPISIVSGGSTSESTGWLQAASGCAAATSSSNEYFSSTQYTDMLNSTQSFYNNLDGVINATFNASQTSFKNAYTIFDLINVAEIHNSSIPDNSTLTSDVLFQVRTLADTHEWNLGYNASNDMRAIAGKVLAAQIVQFLNNTIETTSKSSFGVQFGAYGSFGSFFGLANLTAADPMFYGIADYASSMTFELVTNATVSNTSYPSVDDISVRFLWHNGTASNISTPVAYPLFGGSSTEISWNDFVTNMDDFAIGTTQQWCTACQNTTGICAASTTSSSNSTSSSGSSTTKDEKSGNGLSPAVNGVIGAMVTLAVVLGIEALILLVGGYKVVSKKALAGGAATAQTINTKA